MKSVMILLGLILKVMLILCYCLTKGGELLLTAFNEAFKKLIDNNVK